jgi:hypothetical protein
MKTENMKLIEIWFGDMSHGQFSINGDSEPMVVVHDICEKAYMSPEDIEIYMESEGYDSYLIPKEFTGSIVFSQEFLQRLT